MTPEELETAAREKCPHCAVGAVLRYRPETNEWIHDYATPLDAQNPRFGARIGHTMCQAHDLRIVHGQP
jgi:hypothetical protein